MESFLEKFTNQLQSMQAQQQHGENNQLIENGMRYLFHNICGERIGLLILLPGFCGRTGGPSQRARTAAGLLRPPRRSS